MLSIRKSLIMGWILLILSVVLRGGDPATQQAQSGQNSQPAITEAYTRAAR